MKIFLFITILLIALMAGLGIGYLVQIDTGYVRVSWNYWLMETNIWIAFLALVIAYFGLNFLLKTIGTTLAAKAGLVQWHEKGATRRAQSRTTRGLLALAEGNWRKAERYLTRGAKQSSAPLINYLAAAQAANEQGKKEESDRLLQQASESIEGGDIAIGLTQAQLQLSRGQLEESQSTLEYLRQQKPNHPFVLKLLQQVYSSQQNWQQLTALLPELRRLKVLSETELGNLEQQVWSQSLVQATQQARLDKPGEFYTEPLDDIWNRMPSALRRSPAMLLCYVEQLVSLSAKEHALSLVKKHLRQDWNKDLVLLYGQIIGSDVAAQLNTAENWQNTHPQDAVLLLTLGRLARASKDLPKAEEYFLASLKSAESAEVYTELGQLMIQLQAHAKASEYLLSALTPSTPAISAP